MAQRWKSIHAMPAPMLRQRQNQSTSSAARQRRLPTVKPSVPHPPQQRWLVPCFKLGQLAEEVETFLGESPSNLTHKNHQPHTSILTGQLKVASLFPPSCCHGRCPIDISTPRMRTPVQQRGETIVVSMANCARRQPHPQVRLVRGRGDQRRRRRSTWNTEVQNACGTRTGSKRTATRQRTSLGSEQCARFVREAWPHCCSQEETIGVLGCHSLPTAMSWTDIIIIGEPMGTFTVGQSVPLKRTEPHVLQRDRATTAPWMWE